MKLKTNSLPFLLLYIASKAKLLIFFKVDTFFNHISVEICSFDTNPFENKRGCELKEVGCYIQQMKQTYRGIIIECNYAFLFFPMLDIH